MEVQALAALGYHENIVGYYSSWFENKQLYIQLELCEHSLSLDRIPKLFTEREALEAMYQIAKALQFIHGRGVVHLDVKPENIYVKNGVYKLGDFGCATVVDKSWPIEEGDARYMPQEILNENYENLDKVDKFSLGASIYELARGSPLPESVGVSISMETLSFQICSCVMAAVCVLETASTQELFEENILQNHLIDFKLLQSLLTFLLDKEQKC
ncbi:hypothetical protein ABFS82_13G045400 [Erythranthe guttata]